MNPLARIACGIYDVRARQWSPEMGAFLAVDELAMHDKKGTLWSWTRQNTLFADPSGRLVAYRQKPDLSDLIQLLIQILSGGGGCPLGSISFQERDARLECRAKADAAADALIKQGVDPIGAAQAAEQIERDCLAEKGLNPDLAGQPIPDARYRRCACPEVPPVPLAPIPLPVFGPLPVSVPLVPALP